MNTFAALTMYIPPNGTMDFTPLQLAPLIAADQNPDTLAGFMIASSKKRKRTAETLNLREFVSYLPVITNYHGEY